MLLAETISPTDNNRRIAENNENGFKNKIKPLTISKATSIDGLTRNRII